MRELKTFPDSTRKGKAYSLTHINVYKYLFAHIRHRSRKDSRTERELLSVSGYVNFTKITAPEANFLNARTL